VALCEDMCHKPFFLRRVSLPPFLARRYSRRVSDLIYFAELPSGYSKRGGLV
jgi:hypothetical protein